MYVYVYVCNASEIAFVLNKTVTALVAQQQSTNTTTFMVHYTTLFLHGVGVGYAAYVCVGELPTKFIN